MQVKSRIVGALFAALVMIQGAIAAPAIQNSNFSNGSAWSTAGVAGGASVAFGQTNSNILGGDTYGLVVGRGGTAGASSQSFFNQVVFNSTSIGAVASNFGNAMSDAKLTGIYQAFTTSANGSIVFDAVGFVNSNGQTGDPFVFLFNTDDYTGTLIRGGQANSELSPTLMNGDSGLALGTAQRPDSRVNRVLGSAATAAGRLAGTSYTLTGVTAGNWIIGFGYGVVGTNSTYGGFAVTNVQLVPEIDTASAGLPIAIAMLLFFVVSDRRGRKESAVIG